MGKQDPWRLTDLASLELVPLETEQGERLGRVFDLRAKFDPGRPQQPPVVTAITYGTLGFLERLGVRRTRPRTIEWKSVVEVRPDRIVVRKKR
ncbi:MAG TPA: hypothetical protein VFC24_04130 [Casimicrobiaceae bacterium]|nr:hypothetical protein [Casimicrobiaceae bacterium]